jgi:drug/metabolite transporter (DMT)-like permease
MSRSALLRLCLLALIWGSSFLLIKLAIEGVSPTQLVLGRLVAGAGVLLVILALRGQRLPSEPAVWGHVAVLAVVANIIPFFLFAWGELRITSGMAGILNGTTPLFTLGFAVAALPEERLSRQRFVGFLLGFAGVVVVVGPWTANGANALSGQLACLLAAACYGVAFVYTRRFVAMRGYPPLVVSAAQLLTGSVLLGLASPVILSEPMELDGLVVSSVLLLGAVGTGLAYLLFYRLVTEAGATSASMVTYLIPIVAVALGIIVQNDPVTWNLFAGAGIVIAGAALAEGRLRLRPSVEAPVAATRQESS